MTAVRFRTGPRLPAKASSTCPIRLLLVGACLLWLVGCATPPRSTGPVQPVFAAPVVDAADEDVSDYWVKKRTEGRFPISSDQLRRFSDQCARARIAFIIDSNGRKFNPEFLELEPEAFRQVALQLLARLEYEPSEANPERIPVRTEMTITLELTEPHRVRRNAPAASGTRCFREGSDDS